MHPTRTLNILVAVHLSVLSLAASVVSADSPYQIADVREALTAFGTAETYPEVLLALTEREALFADSRVHGWLDQSLASPELSEQQRLFLMTTRKIARDVEQRGAVTAAQLFSARYIVAAATTARSPGDLAAEMDRFESFAPDMTPALVRSALESSGYAPRDDELALIDQLALDWRSQGSLSAATRLLAATQDNRSAGSPAGGSPPRYFEDRIAEGFINLGEPIPDGLISIPSQ